MKKIKGRRRRSKRIKRGCVTTAAPCCRPGWSLVCQLATHTALFCLCHRPWLACHQGHHTTFRHTLLSSQQTIFSNLSTMVPKSINAPGVKIYQDCWCQNLPPYLKAAEGSPDGNEVMVSLRQVRSPGAWVRHVPEIMKKRKS